MLHYLTIDNNSHRSLKQAPSCRQPLMVLKDIKDKVDTESLLAGSFEVYQDSSPDEQAPSDAGWPMAGRQSGTAPATTVAPPVEKVHGWLLGPLDRSVVCYV